MNPFVVLHLSLYERQRAYEQARDERGVTVAEFEIEHHLPRYYVYPHARTAGPADLGYFMYPRPTREGRHALIVQETRAMRALMTQGLKQVEIARLYGLGEASVSRRVHQTSIEAHP